jgi:hypothetical protein
LIIMWRAKAARKALWLAGFRELNGRKLCAMSVAVSLSPGFSVRIGADSSAARSKFLQYKPQIHPLNVKW